MDSKNKECPICCEVFNKSNHTKITCGNCEYDCCKTCIRTYLLQDNKSAFPSCMNCNTGFSTQFLITNLNRSWVLNGEFKKAKKNALLDHELSKLPDTMALAEAEKNKRGFIKENEELYKEIAALETKKTKIENAILANRYRIRGEDVPQNLLPFASSTDKSVKILHESKRSFIMGCPDSCCNGFLSKNYKCGLCEKFSCPDCLQIIGCNKQIEHTCNADDLATAKMIRKETRPCPNCGERIFKIEGCDQMFCTQCHTAFSWKTGKIETGTIHNPHYYEIQRQEGIQIRNPHDVPCGGMNNIAFNRLIRILRWTCDDRQGELFLELKSFSENILTLILDSHRTIAEFQQYEIPRLREQIRNGSDCVDARILYLLKDIDKEQLAQMTYSKDRHLKINTDRLHILEILSTCGTEFIRAIAEHPSVDFIRETIWYDLMCNRNGRGRVFLIDNNWIDYGDIDEVKDIVIPTLFTLLNEIEKRIEEFSKIKNYCNDQLKQHSMYNNITTFQINNSFRIIHGRKFTLKGDLVGAKSKKNTILEK